MSQPNSTSFNEMHKQNLRLIVTKLNANADNATILQCGWPGEMFLYLERPLKVSLHIGICLMFHVTKDHRIVGL